MSFWGGGTTTPESLRLLHGVRRFWTSQNDEGINKFMASEQEQSLQKRSELVPEKLMRGGLIVGVEQGIQGSLMSVTGAAIERITRERTEVPPQFKLPERPVYFLDPNTRRLIMISNRENRGENKTPDKYGLFAEIVELDEEGKPHYRLSSSEIILPDDNYHLVAVGPNSFGLPPSHIEVTEEEEGGKKKFVPWNVRLAELQNWMTQVTVNPEESLEDFLERFDKLKDEGRQKVNKTIEQAFPRGNQGFNDTIKPINLIITPQGKDGILHKASVKAGLYPFLVKPADAAEVITSAGRGIRGESKEISILGRFFQSYTEGYSSRVAVVTVDDESAEYPNNEEDESGSKYNNALLDQFMKIAYFISELQRKDSMFAVVRLPNMDVELENSKDGHGYYISHNDQEYELLLNKLKADLLLTMFLRGGASIVK